MRERGRGGDGGRDWGSIDWSNIDLSGFGRGTRVPGPSRRAVLIALVLVVLLVIPLFVGPVVGFLTDLLWFRSLGLEDVYLRRYTAGFWAFLAFSGLFFALALPNLYFALRPQVPRVVVDTDRRRRGAVGSTLRYMWLLLIPAFFFGIAGGDQWDPLLRWLNAVPFGVSDPVFGRDIGFYFFTLPVLEFVRGWLIVAVVVIAIGVVALYLTRGVIGVATGSLASADIRVAGRTALALARPARAHLSILGGLFLALIAGGYLLDQFELLFRQETVLSIDPERKRVVTSGGTYEADILVVALGADLAPEATPGLLECGHEFYSPEGAARVREILATFDGGAVVQAPQAAQVSVCRRYSVTSGTTRGSSATWCRAGWASSPLRTAAQC